LEGFLLFCIASRVLDPTTKRLFVYEYHNVDTPTLDLLLKFQFSYFIIYCQYVLIY